MLHLESDRLNQTLVDLDNGDHLGNLRSRITSWSIHRLPNTIHWRPHIRDSFKMMLDIRTLPRTTEGYVEYARPGHLVNEPLGVFRRLFWLEVHVLAHKDA